MAMERRQSELPMLSRKFGSDYFDRLYRGSGDKNPVGKIKTYLRLIKRSLSWSQKRPGLATQGLALSNKLLDIGCGYGRFLKEAEKEFETYGVDPSEYAIAEAGKYAINTKFEVATISSYRPKKSFDVITAFDVLEHVDGPEKAVARVKSWLKPEGIFFCVVPVYDGPLGWIAGKLDRDETHINKWSRARWLELFAKHFEVLTAWGAIRYSLGNLGYFHFASPYLSGWGQAILVVMRK